MSCSATRKLWWNIVNFEMWFRQAVIFEGQYNSRALHQTLITQYQSVSLDLHASMELCFSQRRTWSLIQFLVLHFVLRLLRSRFTSSILETACIEMFIVQMQQFLDCFMQ